VNWRTILPFAAAAGIAVGIYFGDYFLVVLAILLLAGAYFWKPTDDEGET
jgi:hypothetical protein